MSMFIKRMMECPKCGHQYDNGGLTKSLTLLQLKESVEKMEIEKQIEIEMVKAQIGKLEGEEK